MACESNLLNSTSHENKVSYTITFNEICDVNLYDLQNKDSKNIFLFYLGNNFSLNRCMRIQIPTLTHSYYLIIDLCTLHSNHMHCIL